MTWVFWPTSFKGSSELGSFRTTGMSHVLEALLALVMDVYLVLLSPSPSVSLDCYSELPTLTWSLLMNASKSGFQTNLIWRSGDQLG